MGNRVNVLRDHRKYSPTSVTAATDITVGSSHLHHPPVSQPDMAHVFQSPSTARSGVKSLKTDRIVVFSPPVDNKKRNV